ncbi:MFS transporter [Antrihabitans cavernicola]|uniref:MFS transporter n=2 Tax=Antrihabitans cavernicola TaxID=2495913 RepID=A0A5A7SIS9_9NOCA|nr:MFS transporter [Spelaeibacter cavernicola]
MLGLGVLAQSASAVFVNGAAFLIPSLHGDRGLSFAQAGVVVAMPTLGIMTALIAWGVVADRRGERFALTVGTALTAIFGVAAALTTNLPTLGVFLFLGGAAAASTNSASGRVVVGWFPPERRGLAMGIRQMAQPVGVGIAALTIPGLASAHGVASAMLLPAGVSALAAVLCFVGIIDPPRPDRAQAAEQGLLANPYRGQSVLWRIHAVSMLLVIPQFTVWTYSLVWLITDRHWSPAAAGILVTITQVAGALGRIAAGAWSDRLHSRLRPLRQVAIGAALSMGALALAAWLDSPISVALLLVASAITVADNGLAFTAVAEIAGPYWSGRALGTQNTGQYLIGSAVPPVFGLIIGSAGFGAAYLIAAVIATAAVPLVPRDKKSES